MRTYAAVGDGSEALDYPGVTIASSGLDVPVFNSAMLNAEPADLPASIATAAVHYKNRKLGWTFWLCEDMLRPEQRDWVIRTAFRNKGMMRIASPPGMYAPVIKPRTKPAAPLTMHRVACARTRLDFAHVASAVFALSFRTAKQIYCATGVWDGPSYGWVAYYKGKPVAIVTVVIASGALGVYSLGTLPQHQGCGFGETLLRHALEHAQHETGLACSVLQSTPQGLNLYVKMGYRVVTRFSIYLREGCGSF